MAVVVEGTCSSRFAPVREAFEQVMQVTGERGGSVSLYQEGELKLNLWAGTCDKERQQAWQQDTLVNVFSTTKGVAALAVQKALDMGLLDVSRRVAYYWPEYGVEGKKDTLVSWMLNHRAGQPALREPLPDEALFDWERMTNTLARERPWWEPGRQHGYHMVTYGWLVGEVFKRAVGVTLGQFLREEIAAPHGLDMWLGVPDTEMGRVAALATAADKPAEGRIWLFEKVMQDRECMTAKALCNPMSIMTSSNSLAWRTMELPSANLHATAASLATLYGKVVCREGIISAQALQRCQQTESQGDDPVLFTQTRFGPGFMLNQPGHVEGGFGPGSNAFGHFGSGGSIAFGDPDAGLGFAFAMNQMGPYVLMDPRPRQLIDAVYASLQR